MDVMAGLTAVSETLKITKELRSIEKNIDRAELKLRLTDLIDGLLEAKEAWQDAKQREQEFLDENRKHKELLVDKSKYEDERGRLYRLDDEGNRVGEPYCNLYYIREEKLYRLIYNKGGDGWRPSYHCDNHNGRIDV